MNGNSPFHIGVALFALGACLPGFAARPLEIVSPGDAVDFVAVAMGITPDYAGSDETTIGAAPLLSWEFAKGQQLTLIATELSVDLLPDPDWKLGPVVNYRIGRDDVKDPIVQMLAPIDGTFEGGIAVSYAMRLSEDPRHRINLSADLLGDLGNNHRGLIGGLSANYLHPLSRRLAVFFGAGLNLASAQFSETYFGITDGDIANFPSLNGVPFRPKGGVIDFRLNTGLLFHVTERWHLLGGAQWQRLTGTVADSPIVRERGDPSQWVFGSGVGYAF